MPWMFGIAAGLALLLFATTALAQDEHKKDIRESLRQALAKDIGFAARCAAVVIGGKIYWTHATGRASKKTPATTKTLFPMGLATRAMSNLVVARMQESGELDVQKRANEFSAPFVLRDQAGKPSQYSLARVMHGGIKMVKYLNYMELSHLANWDLRRILEEHAVLGDPYNEGIQLRYGIAQVAVENTAGKPWHTVVARHLAQPLGMKSLVVDPERGLPGDKVQLIGEAPYVFPLTERKCHSKFAAAEGAWIHAEDLGRLLKTLVAGIPKGVKDDGVADLSKRIQFAGFSVQETMRDPRPHMVMAAGIPGMRGGIYVYPQYRTAWAIFANYDHMLSRTPNYVLVETFRDLILPPPPKAKGDPVWNTAVGQGGDSKIRKRLDPRLAGSWEGTIRVQGRGVSVRFRIADRTIRSVSIGERTTKRLRKAHERDMRLHVRTASLLPIRRDLRNLENDFELELDAATGHLRGTLTALIDEGHGVQGNYCYIEFPLDLTRTKAGKK